MSYTLVYGKSYEEWINERAKRIRNYLNDCFLRNQEINLFDFAYYVYHERLSLESFSKWKPYENRFLDLKPSPFIKNYLLFVIERLREDGYVQASFSVEIVETLTLTESLNENPTNNQSSNNETQVRVIPHYYVKQLPSLEYLTSLAY